MEKNDSGGRIFGRAPLPPYSLLCLEEFGTYDFGPRVFIHMRSAETLRCSLSIPVELNALRSLRDFIDIALKELEP